MKSFKSNRLENIDKMFTVVSRGFCDYEYNYYVRYKIIKIVYIVILNVTRN